MYVCCTLAQNLSSSTGVPSRKSSGFVTRKGSLSSKSWRCKLSASSTSSSTTVGREIFPVWTGGESQKMIALHRTAATRTIPMTNCNGSIIGNSPTSIILTTSWTEVVLLGCSTTARSQEPKGHIKREFRRGPLEKLSHTYRLVSHAGYQCWLIQMTHI